MMHKATLTFSLLFLAVVGSAQSDGEKSIQPSPNFSSSEVYPSGGGIPTISTMSMPTAIDGNSSQTNGTRPSGCFPHHSAFQTDQPLPSGVLSSAAHGASNVSKPHFSCEPDSESNYTTIPTGTASVPQYSEAGGLPSTYGSGPMYASMAPNGSYPDNSTLPTGSPMPSNGTGEPPAATATTSYVGRRMLVRRQF